MSFVRSSTALQEEGIKSRKSYRRRFKYVDKSRDRFYLRFLPAADGFEPRAIPYHQNLAQLVITNMHTGKDTEIRISARCLEGKNDCSGCTAAKAQKEANPNYKTDANFWKNDKSQRVGQFAVVYECYLNEDQTFSYKKENNLPQLLEYQYKYGTCSDWDQLVDVIEDLQRQGIDFTGEKDGVVIRVERKKVPSKNGNTMRTVWEHSYTGKSLPLPADWKQTLTGYDKVVDTHFNLSSEDIDCIINIEQAMRLVRADKSKSEEQKMRELDELTNELKDVQNKDFVDLIDALHTKEDKSEGVGASHSPSPRRAEPESRATGGTDYASASGQSLSTPPQQTSKTLEDGPVVAEPAVSPSTRNALDRVRALRKKAAGGSEGL